MIMRRPWRPNKDATVQRRHRRVMPRFGALWRQSTVTAGGRRLGRSNETPDLAGDAGAVADDQMVEHYKNKCPMTVLGRDRSDTGPIGSGAAALPSVQPQPRPPVPAASLSPSSSEPSGGNGVARRSGVGVCSHAPWRSAKDKVCWRLASAGPKLVLVRQNRRRRCQTLGRCTDKLLDRQPRAIPDLGEPAEDSPRQDYGDLRSNQ